MNRKSLLVIQFLVIIFPILSQGFMTVKPIFGAETSSSAAAFSIGAQVIPPFLTLNYTNTVVNLNESLIFEFKGLLILKNSTLNMISSSNITFMDSALEAENSKINGGDPFYIYFEGDSSATVSETTVTCGRGGLFIGGSTKAVFSQVTLDGSVQTYDSSSLIATKSRLNPSVAKLNPEQGFTFMQAFNRSTISISSSTVREISTYNNAVVSILSSVIILPSKTMMRTFNSSKMIVMDSGELWRLEARDYSSALIVNTKLLRLDAYDFSLVSTSRATFSDGMNVYGFSNVYVSDSIFAETVSLTAYLSIYGSSTVSVSGTRMSGILSAHDSSIVSVTDSTIEWLSAGDSSETSISRSKISSLFAHEHSSVTIQNTVAASVHTYDTSYVSMKDSDIALLSATQSSIVSLTASEVNETIVYFKYVNGSLSGISTGIIKEWGTLSDVQWQVGSGGYAPQISVSNVEIDAWSLFFSGSPNVTISNSIINTLSITNTTAKIVGSTVSSYDLSGGAKAYLYWYLDLQVPSNASVTVSYSNMTVAESKQADNQGKVSFTLFEKTIDSAGGSSGTATYTIDVSSSDFSGRQTVEMTSNKQLVLTPPPPFWLQYWYIIAALAVAALLVTLVWRRARARRSPAEAL